MNKLPIPTNTTLTLRRTDTLLALTEKLLAIKTMSDDELWDWWCGLSDEWKFLLLDDDIFLKNEIIERLHHIDALFISQYDDYILNDLSPLLNLKKLTSLQFHDCDSECNIDLETISKLTNLKTLNLSWSAGSGNFFNYFDKIYNLDFLENLKLLECLSFGSPYIKDLIKLNKLKNLKILDIAAENINNFDCIESLVNLQELTVRSGKLNNNLIFQKNSKIKHLYLQDCNIKNIDFIEPLHQLQSLNLSYNSIESIEILSNLKNIKSLSLRDNKISEISHLSNLSDLEILFLNCNKITNISSLNSLKKLRHLDLRENYITDISPLYNLSQLETLIIEDNPVSEYDIDTFKKKNPNCTIYTEAHYGFLKPW